MHTSIPIHDASPRAQGAAPPATPVPFASAAQPTHMHLTCHGCKGNWYTAPGGQPTYPGAPEILSKPHTRCVTLGVYVPMVLGEHGKWLGSEVPGECPEHRQPGLFI